VENFNLNKTFTQHQVKVMQDETGPGTKHDRGSVQMQKKNNRGGVTTNWKRAGHWTGQRVQVQTKTMHRNHIRH
jgi:hypothetical protein